MTDNIVTFKGKVTMTRVIQHCDFKEFCYHDVPYIVDTDGASDMIELNIDDISKAVDDKGVLRIYVHNLGSWVKAADRKHNWLKVVRDIWEKW